MELPPALFEDVTGQPAYAPNPWPDERPIPAWVFLGQRATVVRDNEPVDPADAIPTAMIGRVSILGVGLVHDEPIPVGEVFTLVLPRRHGRTSLPVRCTCTRCEEAADLGRCRIGAVFTAFPEADSTALAA